MGEAGSDEPEIEEVFRLDWLGTLPWHEDDDPRVGQWLSVGVDAAGEWWFDAYYWARSRFTGGAPRVAEFARWLSGPFPAVTDPFCADFLVTDQEFVTAANGHSYLYDLTLSRTREQIGGPEDLVVCGDAPGLQLGAAVVYESVDRPTLERATAGLLARAQGSA
ncbi:hypothetical protein [Yinghuangia seranimata]|uniref:hypothetical protein n=1 Tax=Yinghuangia seranimata TaxID=408067 RepID=UPI00248B22D2|nr:hypothetical protein [Yinghuangia seranimata]MDI2129068.1 hypothetical protein [Yinghuangia seranimata]